MFPDKVRQRETLSNDALFEVVANNTSDLIVVAGLDGAVRYVSPACGKLTGYTAEELTGNLNPELVHPKDRARLSGFLETLAACGSCTATYRILRRDGACVWIESTVNVRRDAITAEPVEVVAISRDITARKRAEEKIDVLEASPNAIIMVGTDGRITLVNIQTEKLFGYDREELLGQPVEILVPKRFRKNHRGHRNVFHAASLTLTMGAGRVLFGLRKDGSEVPVEIGLNTIETPDGPFVLASLVDISERRKAEERFQLLVEAAPNAIVMVGTDGLIALVNTETEKLFGYSREELLGRPVEMLVPERVRPDHAGYRDMFFGAPAPRAMGAGRVLFGLRKDGSEVPVEIGLNPLVTASGQFVVASVIDITERRKSQEVLRRSLAEKTVLLKEVHHRVKNNLQVICSLLSMQIACSDGELFQGPLTTAHSRVLAMSLIHEQIYRSETLADLDFGGYIELLADRVFGAYCVDPSRIGLVLSVEAIHLNVDDAIPCGLILNELLSNSLKHAFSDGRAGVIRISLRKPESDYVELTVADNGIGLPEDFQLTDSRSLGLQVVNTLIHQLRADLCVTGSGGASFRFGWKC